MRVQLYDMLGRDSTLALTQKCEVPTLRNRVAVGFAYFFSGLSSFLAICFCSVFVRSSTTVHRSLCVQPPGKAARHCQSQGEGPPASVLQARRNAGEFYEGEGDRLIVDKRRVGKRGLKHSFQVGSLQDGQCFFHLRFIHIVFAVIVFRFFVANAEVTEHINHGIPISQLLIVVKEVFATKVIDSKNLGFCGLQRQAVFREEPLAKGEQYGLCLVLGTTEYVVVVDPTNKVDALALQ